MRKSTRHPWRGRALALAAATALAGAPLAPALADHHGDHGGDGAEKAKESHEAQDREAPQADETPEEAALRAEVNQALRRDEFVAQYDIRPWVDEHTVTLRGSVMADYEKEKAGEVARRVDGVQEVDNQILVGKVGDEADVGTLTAPQPGGRGLQ